MAVVTGTAILIGAGISAAVAGYGIHQQNKANKQHQANYEQQLDAQGQQAALLEEQKEQYRQFEFKNPYADLQNRFSNMQNPYEDMENRFEGMQNPFQNLGVATQAAEFQAEQGTQQRANILGSLQGAAGSSGIAGLAQSLANQGIMQSRQIAAGIEQQEMANQRLSAQGQFNIDKLQREQAANLDRLEAQGAFQTDLLDRKGQSAVDMAIMGGEAMLQEAEMQRQSTLLGMEYSSMDGANQSVQQAYANQMQSQMATNQSIMSLGANVSNAAFAYAGAQ